MGTDALTSSKRASAHRRPETGGDRFRVFEVDGFLFRLDATRPDRSAMVLKDGSWEIVPLTGEDICGLVCARRLSPDEVASFLALPPARVA